MSHRTQQYPGPDGLHAGHQPDRQPAPRDAADLHPATHTDSVTGSVTDRADDQPAGTGRAHGRDRLRVVGPDHVEPAPADDPGVVLDIAQAQRTRAILERHAAPFLAGDEPAVLRDFAEALVVVVLPGARLFAEQVADELFRCSSIGLQPDDVADALRRGAATRP